MRFICILSFITITNAAQVTFIVDMSEETVVAGQGNYPAVYVSGSNLNGPSGIEMTDNGDGTWELTTELESGDYTYKFRNGYYNYWDGPGYFYYQNPSCHLVSHVIYHNTGLTPYYFANIYLFPQLGIKGLKINDLREFLGVVLALSFGCIVTS